ncbi:MAG TPA: hypothetical protein VGM04_06500 [Sphingomicrobium sp.]|jgi:hypothetical protein
MTEVSVREVALDPEWLPHTYDAEGANLISVRVSREARSELVFLSDRHFAGNFQKAAFPRAAVAAEAISAERAPIHFIFHSSHCCSTLLAKALEVPGVSSLLNEPDVMINLANRFIRSDDNSDRERLELVLRLLERPLAPGEKVIVKPTNFGNRIAEPILATRPNSRAILLYSDLETLLFSLAKRGMFGWIFGRQLFNQISQWSPLDFGYSPTELLEQTDMQITALAWLMQMHHLDALGRAVGPDRVMLLDSNSLLADPSEALAKAQALFGLELDSARVEAIASGPVFTKHSKTPGQDYNADAREQERKATADAHAEDIAMVVEWIKAVAAQVGAPLRPGS